MFWQKKLSDFMRKEHERMEVLLAKLNSTDKDFEIFSELRKILENHVYAEEKATRLLYKNGKTFPALTRVIEEHKEIESSLDELGSGVKTKTKKLEKIAVLAGLLKKHLEYEDKNFYPYLDSSLSRSERDEILQILKKNLH
jgi:hemerythrin-like domain-containing protein